MKLCTPYLIIRQKRLARFRASSRMRLVSKRRLSSNEAYVRPGESIIAPTIITLDRPDGIHMVKFLRAIANTVLNSEKSTRLDFRNTKTIHVSGAILLFAELDRIISLSTLHKPITITEPRQSRPRQVLKQIGILQLTGDTSDVIPVRDDVVFWKSTKGYNQTGDALGPILEFVADRANRDHVKQVELSGIWRGVSEAVANTVDHAYILPRGDGFSGLSDTKWWMFTQIRNQYFSAAVCDLGCGYSDTINLTLPEEFRALWQQLLPGINKDVVAIQTAMEYGRSGTHANNRGKGSRDALSILKKHGTGWLQILSNGGWLKLEYSNGVETKIESGEIGIDIRGTIIWWTLPLQGVTT